MSEVLFLLWSNKYQAWWRWGALGYTPDADHAGRFTEAEAVKYVVRSAMCGDLSQVTSMVAAPDNWSELEAAGLRVIAGPGPLSQVLPEALERMARSRHATADELASFDEIAQIKGNEDS